MNQYIGPKGSLLDINLAVGLNENRNDGEDMLV